MATLPYLALPCYYKAISLYLLNGFTLPSDSHLCTDPNGPAVKCATSHAPGPGSIPGPGSVFFVVPLCLTFWPIVSHNAYPLSQKRVRKLGQKGTVKSPKVFAKSSDI